MFAKVHIQVPKQPGKNEESGHDWEIVEQGKGE